MQGWCSANSTSVYIKLFFWFGSRAQGPSIFLPKNRARTQPKRRLNMFTFFSHGNPLRLSVGMISKLVTSWFIGKRRFSRSMPFTSQKDEVWQCHFDPFCKSQMPQSLRQVRSQARLRLAVFEYRWMTWVAIVNTMHFDQIIFHNMFLLKQCSPILWSFMSVSKGLLFVAKGLSAMGVWYEHSLAGK